MAKIAVTYSAVEGQPFTPADFNGLWPSAVITLDASEVVESKIANDAVTKDKIHSNIAGSGLAQDVDGSLKVKGKGFLATALDATGVNLTSGTSENNQHFTGVLGASVSIAALLTSAVAGDTFELTFASLDLGAFELTIKSNISTLLTFSGGTLSGGVRLVYSGSVWVVTLNATLIS